MDVGLNALDLLDAWVGLIVWELKAPVHVLPLHVASVIPKDHSIWVGYWDDPKFKGIPKLLHLSARRKQMID